MEWWDDFPYLLAGKDLKQGGTWMGVTKQGKFSAITNFRDKKLDKENPVTRGNIVRGYLTGKQSPGEYLTELHNEAGSYSGFNILAGSANDLHYYSNSNNTATPVEDGIHGLSNGMLNEPWHKVVLGKKMFTDELSKSGIDIERLFDILRSKIKAEDEMLPDTGIGKRLERMVSPMFIKTPFYGTRCSTVLLIGNDNRVYVKERRFNALGKSGESEFEFEIES